MLIKMLETRRGTRDGFKIENFEACKDYEIPDHLALAFIAAGFAVPVRRKKND